MFFNIINIYENIDLCYSKLHTVLWGLCFCLQISACFAILDKIWIHENLRGLIYVPMFNPDVAQGFNCSNLLWLFTTVLQVAWWADTFLSVSIWIDLSKKMISLKSLVKSLTILQSIRWDHLSTHILNRETYNCWENIGLIIWWWVNIA